MVELKQQGSRIQTEMENLKSKVELCKTLENTVEQLKGEVQQSVSAKETAEGQLWKASFEKKQLLQKIENLEQDIQALKQHNSSMLKATTSNVLTPQSLSLIGTSSDVFAPAQVLQPKIGVASLESLLKPQTEKYQELDFLKPVVESESNFSDKQSGVNIFKEKSNDTTT